MHIMISSHPHDKFYMSDPFSVVLSIATYTGSPIFIHSPPTLHISSYDTPKNDNDIRRRDNGMIIIVYFLYKVMH